MFKKLKLKPAKIGILYSFTSTIMSGRAWYHGWAWQAIVEKFLSGTYFMDVIFDYDLENKGFLSRYGAIILPSAFALKKEGINGLQQYINGGGLVLGGKSQMKNLHGLKLIEGLDRLDAKQEVNLDPEEIWSEISKKVSPERVCDNKDIILRESEGKNTRVLVAVNNNRIAGPLFGHYKGALEKGIPVKAKMQVLKGDWNCCYDLTSSKEVKLVETGKYLMIDEEFPPAWGKIYAFYKEKIGGLEIICANQFKPGDKAGIQVKIFNKSKKDFAGLVPVYLEISDPRGRKSDSSHYACAEDSCYEFDWQIPADIRELEGQWSIRVKELASGFTNTKIIDIVSGKKETNKR